MSLIRIVIFGLILVFVNACEQAPEAPEPTPGLDLSFDLIDETGQSVTDEDFAGHLRLVFFGYTSCPDICPITLANISAALESLGDQSEDVSVLFISIDPKRDTPDRLQAYTGAFHPSIIGLTGNYVQIEAVTAGFRTTFGFTVRDGTGTEQPLNRIEYETIPEFADYTPFHSSQVYVIGANDELLDIIGYGSKPAAIEATLRTFLR
jgi:cytochrome oxidase Cu insertion factor (SCO1/SenC/PrrC family)